MSADHLLFLKNKFILDLEDADEEHTGENEVPLRSHFLQIRDMLEAKDITESTPIRLKNSLYNAIMALEDCVVLSEKREPRKKKDGPMHGYTLAEHWLMCKTRRLLVQIKRKLTATADAVIPGITDVAPTSSSTSLPLIPTPNLENFYRWSFRGFDEQVKTILDRLGKRGEGFQEIGIVGIGGSGKTTLAQLVFREPNRRYSRDYRIWICLFPKLSGEVEFKETIKDMLKQCEVAAVVDDGVEVEVEELLEKLGKALEGKRYLMVLDGIWDINIDWYFKLKDKLKSVSGDGHIIITSRLPHKARMMVGPHNLHHMQPPSTSMEHIWPGGTLVLLGKYKLKMKDEVIEQCDGLPLAMQALEAVIKDQIVGEGRDYRGVYGLIVLINLEDDAMLGNDFLSTWRAMNPPSNDLPMVIDVSNILLHHLFNILNQRISSLRHSYSWDSSYTIVVMSGDAMANQLMQVIMQVARNLELDSNPPILLLPLGSKANISFSLGWENQPPGTLPKDVLQSLDLSIPKPAKYIDSWGVVIKMKSTPESLWLPSTFGLGSTLEANLRPMEGEKEFHVTFWNYFIIGLDAEESLKKKDECCGSCYFKPWPRNIVLLICIKIKDQQGKWKEISIPHSTRSIVCLNLPCFPNRPNVKEKYKNFKDPFVNDGLLEVICFRDAWHGDDFLPSKDRGECLGQVGTIQFELYNSAVSHIHMSIDGKRWKHPLPIEDDNKVIEIYHSGKTKVYLNSNSKCKFK